MSRPRGLLALVAVAGCATGGGASYRLGAPPAQAGAPPWIVGTSMPSTLLEFRAESAPAAPAYCRRVSSFLVQLQVAIERNPGGCNLSNAPNLDGSSSLKLSCPLDKLDNGCTDAYSAELWGEQLDASTTDYAIRFFGWAKRVCPPQGAPASAASYERYSDERIREVIGSASPSVQAIVVACRPGS